MKLKILLLFMFFALLAACSSKSPDEPWEEFDPSKVENAIFIEYKGGNAPDIVNKYTDEVTIDANGGNVVVTSAATSKEYNFIVSGATTGGSLKIYGEHKIGLYLNGVSITNSSGPAINIQNGKQISVYLAGEKSFLSGRAISGGEEDAKGAFFSEGQLIFSGDGHLEVAGKSDGHAIATDDYFEIEKGYITITESVKDGIHAKDRVFIKGGTISITSTGDAIQSENLSTYISGGKIIAKTSGIKSHGISSGDSIVISENADIDINVSGNGAKGIKSKGFMDIKSGKIEIKTSGTTHTISEDEENKVSGIKATRNMKISGGDITITSTGTDAKGISADANLEISGGKVTITANHRAIKTDGNLTISGGTVSVKSTGKKKAIACDGSEDIKIAIKNEGASDEF
jgi:hypothetical protein